MPAHETLERFIARVESNAHVEAIEEFYTVNANDAGEQRAAPRGPRHAGWKAKRRAPRPREVRDLAYACGRCFVDGDRS
jgi:hypothetical protein